MKHIVDRNNIRLPYTEEFIERGVPNGMDVLDWNIVETELESNPNFNKNKWNGLEWIEGLTNEEIAQNQLEQQKELAKAFMLQKELDGRAFYKDIDLRITVAFSAMDRNVLFPKLAEIDAVLYPPLLKIKTGDFASALYLFLNQDAPTDAFILDFYNEALQYCQNYYDTKYPK